MQHLVERFFDFLDWFINDFIDSVFNGAVLAWKILCVIWITVPTLPLWILPFIYWLLIERRKH